MSRTLIIPDIHCKYLKAQAILDFQPYDKAIFLGDNFDNYNDTAEQNRKAAIWLKSSLENPKHVHLLGNHDASYWFYPNKHLYCIGFSEEKHHAIAEIMGASWEDIKFYHAQDGILFSHAGLGTRFLQQYRNGALRTGTLDEVLAYLKDSVPLAIDRGYGGSTHSLFDCGYSRGGKNSTGGIIWADFNVDFHPTNFIQIVGHTYHDIPDFKVKNDKGIVSIDIKILNPEDLNGKDWALDLDTALNYFGAIENGVLKVYKIVWVGFHIDNIFEVFSYKLKSSENYYGPDMNVPKTEGWKS